MDKYPLEEGNKSKNYLDEKELYILYYLFRHKRISTMWSNVFVPNPTTVIPKPDDTPKELFERITYRGQSVIVLKYLLDLGKMLDEKDFSIYCNADYSLVEGGFLTEYIGDTMYQYLGDTTENRKNKSIYKTLNKKNLQFLNEILEGKRDTKNIKDGVLFTSLANPPIEAYKEAISNKKASKEFIELVNKLITEYDGGKWNTKDVEKFLEIWYESNKKIFISEDEGIFYENVQQKLARIIFENIDIHLNIKNTEKLENFLQNYLEQFENNELDGKYKGGLTRSFFSSGLSTPLHTKMFGFEKQKEILLNHIEKVYQQYKRNDLEIGSPFFEPEYVGDTKADDVKITLSNENKSCFLFVHTIIALAKSKFFKIKDFSYGATEMFDEYDRGFLFLIELADKFFDCVKIEQKKKTKLDFDENKSVLYIREKEIKIKKFSDQYHTLRIMFEKPEQLSDEWFFSKIAEKYDIAKPPRDKKFYNAFYQINQKLKTKEIDDLFITTRQSVKINKKYLS